jgi:hypothetical protein
MGKIQRVPVLLAKENWPSNVLLVLILVEICQKDGSGLDHNCTFDFEMYLS